MDNQRIKGIELKARCDPHRRVHGKQRKLWKIESRLHYPNAHPLSVFHDLNLSGWGVWSRYSTQARRDQAYAAMVKKEGARSLVWAHWEFRKVDPDAFAR